MFSYGVIFLAFAINIYYIIRRRLFHKYPLSVIWIVTTFIFLVIGSYAGFVFEEYPVTHGHLFIYLLSSTILFVSSVISRYITNGRGLVISSFKHRSSYSKQVFCAVPILLTLVTFGIVALYIKNYGLPMGFEPSQWMGLNVYEERRLETSIEKFWLYRLGFYEIPLINIIFTNIGLRCSKSRAFKSVLYLILLSGLILSFSFAFKKSVALYVFFYIFSKYLMGNVFNFWRVLGIVTLLLGSLFVMYYAYAPGRESDFYIGWFFGKIFHSITSVFYSSDAVIIDYFNKNEVLYGASIPIIPGLLGYEIVNLSKLAMYLKLGADGSAPVGYFASAYANFGMEGVVIFFALLVMALGIIDGFVVKSEYSIIWVYVIAVLFFQMPFTGIGILFSPIAWFQIFMIYGFMKYRVKLKMMSSNGLQTTLRGLD